MNGADFIYGKNRKESALPLRVGKKNISIAAAQWNRFSNRPPAGRKAGLRCPTQSSEYRRRPLSEKKSFSSWVCSSFSVMQRVTQWLLEVTDSDAIQLARGGELIDARIEENPETIEVNWTHTFAVRNKQFVLTSYEDQGAITTRQRAYPKNRICRSTNEKTLFPRIT